MSLQKNFLTNKNTKLNIKVFKLDCKTSKIAGVKKNGYETIL